MIALGLDIGSRTVDAVWLGDGGVVDAVVTDSGYDPAAAARALVDRRVHDTLVATGYGRHGAREAFDCTVVTEIRAYAMGVHALFPGSAGVLDIGGQDTKVIALSPDGRVLDFHMNDKCAAGTGKFLEVMAAALGYTLEEFAAAALEAPRTAAISSMCTVFAESEVTGLVHRGEDRRAIARGLLDSIARRTLAHVRNLCTGEPLVFAGGVAKNPAMVALLREGLGREVVVPAERGLDAQLIGAHGAALCARELLLDAVG